jgi:DNA-binding response OmpR family regulator
MTESLRILVVDDQPDITEILCMHFEVMGHCCCCTNDGNGALEAARTFEPEVGIIDIGLPDISGYDVVRALRSRGSKAFLVALTGWGAPGDVARAIEAGFDRHLLKPVNAGVLHRLIRDAIPMVRDRGGRLDLPGIAQ